MLSPVSGYVYEKRLLIKYINETGTDPMNNQALNAEQLIDVKSKLIFKLCHFSWKFDEIIEFFLR